MISQLCPNLAEPPRPVFLPVEPGQLIHSGKVKRATPPGWATQLLCRLAAVCRSPELTAGSPWSSAERLHTVDPLILLLNGDGR